MCLGFMRYMKGVPEATFGSALAQVRVCPQTRVVRPQLWFPHLATGLASLEGQGIDLAPRFGMRLSLILRPLEAPQSASYFHRFIPGGNQPHKVGKYEFGALRSVLCNSVSIHKMSALSFLCSANGVCSLIFNVLLRKAVCQLWPSLLRGAPVPGKGPPRKHFKSFIQQWLCWLLAWAVNFPPTPPHHRAHPPGEERAR